MVSRSKLQRLIDWRLGIMKFLIRMHPWLQLSIPVVRIVL